MIEGELPIAYPFCERKNCINWKDGRCSLKEPEKNADSCLHFDDAMDFMRLKADYSSLLDRLRVVR